MDGTEIKMRPLKISLFRKFMKKFAELQAVATDNDAATEVLMDCVVIAMEQYSPPWADKALLEENIDLPTVYKVLEAASGIKFDAEGNPTAAALSGKI